MVHEGQGLDRDRAVFRRDDAARGRQVGVADPHVRIGEAFNVSQSAVLRVEVIDGVARGQVLRVGRDRAVLDVYGELDRSHGTVDLRDAVVFHAVLGLQTVVDADGLPQRVGGASV